MSEQKPIYVKTYMDTVNTRAAVLLLVLIAAVFFGWVWFCVL